MKPSEILREAARRVERREMGGCYAIAVVSRTETAFRSGEKFGNGAMEFFWLVKRSSASPMDLWWTGPNRHNERVVGLCLAAAIAESEGQ